jgi:hypothetical protein
MAVLPVSAVKVDGHDSVVNFTSKKNNKNKYISEVNNDSANSRNLAKVPVILMIAMTPSMMNAKTPEQIIPFDENNIEMVIPDNKLDYSTVDFSMVAEDVLPDEQKLPSALKPSNVQYKRSFTCQGKKYTMMYIDIKSVRKAQDVVSSIYFVPSDYNCIERGGVACNFPPVLQKLVYHDLGDLDKDFISVLTTEQACDSNGDNSRIVKNELKLPDEVANDLIHLFNGDTNLKVTTSLGNRVIETNSPKLLGSY